MLAKETQFLIRNLHEPRLLKVITAAEFVEHGLARCAGQVELADVLLYLDDSAGPLHQGLLRIPVAGFMCDSVFDGDIPSGRILLSECRSPGVVRSGDVVALSPASNLVRVLYRRGANSNLLFMTDRCNSLCLMCSQPPKDIDDRWHIEENLRLLDLMDAGEEHLGISGGEPTLYREGLLAVLNKAKIVIPDKPLHLLSNGRLLQDPTWIGDLQALDHPKLSWGIPLYADNAGDHDQVVQAPGAFSETLRGLYNLARANQIVEIRVVLNRLTTPRLPQLALFLFRNLPFVRHVAFMGIESTGLARKHHTELWIDPLDYQQELSEAVFFLHHRGIPVSLYNLPLCLVAPPLRPFARQSISDWKNLFIDACQDCAAVNRCSGFFKSHNERWQSRGIQPLAAEALSSSQGARHESA